MLSEGNQTEHTNVRLSVRSLLLVVLVMSLAACGANRESGLVASPTATGSNSVGTEAAQTGNCPMVGAPTKVPAVAGLSAEFAYKTLAGAGLLAATQPTGGGPMGPAPPVAQPGSVVTQEPPVGAASSVGDKVMLAIAVNSTPSSGGAYAAPPSSLPADWCRTG